MDILLGLLAIFAIGFVNVAGLYVFAHIIDGFSGNVKGMYYDYEQYLQSNGSIVSFRYRRFHMGIRN